MSGPEWSLAGHLGAGRYASAAMRILARVLGLPIALERGVTRTHELPGALALRRSGP